ncbi:MAG TPA: hydrogenase maturation nickel metallochaperone HypA [Sporichthya sp.]|nr:hydrogenase maturation nickel metallochaperone HypA [Sporichthya sp.]
MHELSLCRTIFTIVERTAAGRQVETIHVQVGRLRQVVPDTLRYCWGLLSESTPLAGSVLEVESMPAVVACSRCQAHTHLTDALLVVCGDCGAVDVEVVSGEEFLLTTLDLVSA